MSLRIVVFALLALFVTPAFAATCPEVKFGGPASLTIPDFTAVSGGWTPTTATVSGQPSSPKTNQGGLYQWTQISGPAGTLTNATTPQMLFTAPDVGAAGATVRLRLTVTGCGGSASDTYTINITDAHDIVVNAAPHAVASASPASPNEGTTVTLNGSASSDPNGDALSYSWLQIGGPTVTLAAPNQAITTFTAPNVTATTTLTFRLTVSDGSLSDSNTALVSVVWINEPPVAALSCPLEVNEGQALTLNGSASSDSDDGIASYQWQQLVGLPAVAGIDTWNTATKTFNAPQLGFQQSGVVPFKLTVTDYSGAKSSADCSIFIHDVTKPVITTPANIVAEASSAAGTNVGYAVSAFDIVDGSLPVVNYTSYFLCAPPSGALFALDAATPVLCSALDSAGNQATAGFSVRVVDTTAPSINVPLSFAVEAAGPAGATANYVAKSTDAVDGEKDAVCAPASGSMFAINAPGPTTTVTCNATDAHANAAQAKTFEVAVHDTTPPAFDPASFADVTEEATSASGATVNFALPSASDLVDLGNVVVTCTPASPHVFPLGQTNVDCKAVDTRGNDSAAAFHVSVLDRTAPALHLPADIIAEATSANGAAVSFSASATDLVDANVDLSCSPNSGDTFVLGTTTVHCTGIDDADNSASGDFSVTVRDTTKPTLQLPADITMEATGPAGAVVAFSVSASDLVDASVDLNCSANSGDTFALGTTTVSCTGTDDSGNSASGSFAVKVQDTTAPALNLPANIITEATGPAGAAATFVVSAIDIVDTHVELTCSANSGDTFALGTTTVSCTGTDDSSNSTSGSFTIKVQDTTAPALNLPANIITEATGPAGAAATFVVSAIDIVDTHVDLTCSANSGDTFALGTTTVSCTGTDDSSNSTSGSFTIKVQDTTAPALNLPANIITEATGPAGAAATFVVSAIDIVDTHVDLTCSANSGDTFALGTTTVHCTGTDDSSNSTSGSFTIKVQDTTAPALHLPSDITMEATGPSGAAVTFTVSATDIVDTDVALTCSANSGDTFALGTTTVSCTGADDSGNSASGNFAIKVQDTTAPALHLPSDITREATGPSGAAVTFAVSATDIVDTSVDLTCSANSGDTFALDTTTVHCTGTDDSGNSTSGSFAIKVQDTTAPALNLPADITIEATGPTGAAATFTVSATDIVDTNVALTCSANSGDTFALGTTTVSCTGTDDSSNSTSGSFKVKVQDTTAPTLHLPSNITSEAKGSGGAVVSFTASATDLVDTNVAMTCSPNSGATFALGTTTVNCTGTDDAGNSASGSFTIKVQDTTAPILHLPANVTTEATGPNGAAVPFNAWAYDLVDTSVAMSCSPNSGTTFALGTTTVNCTGTDDAGNSTSGSFTIRVQDTTAPILHLPASITAEATGPNGAAVAFNAWGYDLVDTSVAMTCSANSGDTFALGTTTVNCTGTDDAGNNTSGGFTIKVQDTTAPAISAHGNVTATATGNSTATVNYGMPTASDLVDGTVAVNCTPPQGAFNVGSTDVNCTARDNHGNQGSRTFSVAVNYAFTGFFQPVDNSPALNSVKAGNAVPVKFSLGGNQGMNIFQSNPASGVIACGVTEGDAIEETVTAGSSSLQYDAGAGQYIYVWKTEKSWVGQCRILQIKLKDGGSKTALFKFK
ncbi:hypothetical protein GCM10027430_09530 [Lysobacter tyrosinilyticus]